jgi:large subunit ribosomal protein L24
MKVRSGDEVRVMAGKDRGKTGRVLRVEPRKQKVYVQGLNMIKVHIRPGQLNKRARGGMGGPATQGAQEQGGVIEREGPIHVSNVTLLDPQDHRPTRIGIEREHGKPFRVARRSGARID